jgi:O-antigen/teichoic acid export membrane protein
MKKQLAQLMQKEFVRNVMTLMTGTALGQAFALLLSPVITRLYSPEQFSLFEQYAFLLSIFTVVITGRYEAAVMHPKSKEDARHVVGLSLKVALYVCVALLVIAVAIPFIFTDDGNDYELWKWLWTLPIALFCIAIFNTVNFWFSREKSYKVAATSRLLYSAAGEPIKVVFGWMKSGVSGLIGGTVLGHIVAAWHSWKNYIKSEPRGIKHLSRERMRALAVEHKDYPVYSVAGGVLNNLAQWAHVAVFVFFYGEKAIIPIGFIALSRRIFFNPLGILSSSYSQVFYQRISIIEDARELRKFFLQNFLRILGFSAVMVVIVQMLPDNSLGIIFGASWTDALIYLKVLSYWYGLNFAISTLSFIFNRLKLQWYTLVADITHFIAVITAFWIAWNTGLDELGAVKAMVTAKVIYLLLNIAAVIYFLNRNVRKSQA